MAGVVRRTGWPASQAATTQNNVVKNNNNHNNINLPNLCRPISL